MLKYPISLVITDLDNTLYDWLSAFVPAFYEMVGVATALLGVEEEQLLDDFREVHRKHGDSEHPFALLETRAIRQRFGTTCEADLAKLLDPAFHAFNRTRKQNLKLYEGVYESLERLHRLEVPVVAYTDARVINCLFRLERLRIKNFISRLYAPAHVAKSLDGRALDDHFVRLLPVKDRKPNPQTLIDICSENEVPASDTLYIGDSLVRDIFMAKSAGTRSAWARFGTLYDKTLWPKLVRITHWTEADVEREKTLREEAIGVQPDAILDQFSELFKYFEFKSRSKVERLSAPNPI